jgi:hypothetical protein
MGLDFRHRALTFAGVLCIAVLGPTTAPAQTQYYECRWDKIAGAGGAWTTGWVPNHPSPYCGASAVNRVCAASDFSAAQRTGAQISYWPQGCAAPPWTLQCTCRLEGTQP